MDSRTAIHRTFAGLNAGKIPRQLLHTNKPFKTTINPQLGRGELPPKEQGEPVVYQREHGSNSGSRFKIVGYKDGVAVTVLGKD